jgi:hypothetical protein
MIMNKFALHNFYYMIFLLKPQPLIVFWFLLGLVVSKVKVYSILYLQGIIS